MIFDMGYGLALRLGSPRCVGEGFPTDRLQKGLVVWYEGQELCQEGVGFGVPVLKRPLETIFAGSAEITGQDPERGQLSVVYDMNRAERLAPRRAGLPFGGPLNALKEGGAWLHRRAPVLRRVLTAMSEAARRLLGIRTAFVPIESAGRIQVRYSVSAADGRIEVHVDSTQADLRGVTEIIVMNEQGADCFSVYADSDGAFLSGNAVQTWARVHAAQAAFRDPRRGVEFSLSQVSGAKLLRGRERVPGRLSWSGFAYVAPPPCGGFSYSVRMGVS